jgi:hypothetical protein
MDHTRPNRQLCLGWTLFLFWPLAFAPLLLLPALFRQLDATLLLLPTAFIFVIGILVLIDFGLRLFTTRPTNPEPTYPCPTCGADIEHKPHC